MNTNIEYPPVKTYTPNGGVLRVHTNATGVVLDCLIRYSKDTITLGNAACLLPNAYIRGIERVTPDQTSGLVIRGAGDLAIGNPDFLNYRIGAGYILVHLNTRNFDMSQINNVCDKSIPENHRTNYYNYNKPRFRRVNEVLNQLCMPIDKGKYEPYIGTLGHGCSFIEVLKDKETNDGYLLAKTSMSELAFAAYDYYSTKYKRGNFKHQDYLDYIHDCEVIQKWMNGNRKILVDTMINQLHWKVNKSWDFTSHCITKSKDCPGMYDLRAGAIEAPEGRNCVVLVSAKEGAIIGDAVNTEEWLNALPSGSGRIVDATIDGSSSGTATFDLNYYSQVMCNVNTNTVNELTIASAPMAYRRKAELIKMLSGKMNIKKSLVPIFNYKASYDGIG